MSRVPRIGLTCRNVGMGIARPVHRRGTELSRRASSPAKRRLRGQLRFEMRELFGDLAVFFAVAIDGADRMKHGRVVAAAEVAADFFQAVARVTSRQVHADLTRERDALVALLAL